MKTAVLHQINQPLSLQDGAWQPLKYGQVLVKVLASGICGAQLQEIRGEKGNHFPRLIGHEGCGTVESVGEGVTTVAMGDRVVMHWRKGDGVESQSPEIALGDRVITTGQVTTFSEYSVCSENRLTAVPADVPVELCAMLGCGLSTALGTIENEANLKMGESVLIIGCGGLGLNLILAAKMRRAGSIIGMDISAEKTLPVLAFGARFEVAGIAPHKEQFDVIIDTTGNADSIASGLNRLAPSGRFIMVGQPKPGEHIQIPNARHLFDGSGCCIKATQGGGFQPHLDIPRYVKLWKSGQLDITGIITHRFALDFINEGIELVKSGQAGRVLITP